MFWSWGFYGKNMTYGQGIHMLNKSFITWVDLEPLNSAQIAYNSAAVSILKPSFTTLACVFYVYGWQMNEVRNGSGFGDDDINE